MRRVWLRNPDPGDEIHPESPFFQSHGAKAVISLNGQRFSSLRAWQEATGKDMAREIRSYFIPDFTDWKDHDAFEATYQRLMKDFKPAPDDK